SQNCRIHTRPLHDALPISWSKTMTKTMNHPCIMMVTTTSLIPNPQNARKHSAKQIALIAANIQRYGFLVPIIVGMDNIIAAGHRSEEHTSELQSRENLVCR